jgi:hypothetical protein
LSCKIDKPQYAKLRDDRAIRVGGRTKPLPSRNILRVMDASRDFMELSSQITIFESFSKLVARMPSGQLLSSAVISRELTGETNPECKIS